MHNYFKIHRKKCGPSTDSLASTCINDRDDRDDLVLKSDYHIASSDEQIFSVLSCLELEKEEKNYNHSNKAMENLMKLEKEYDDYKRFLTLLQTNF